MIENLQRLNALTRQYFEEKMVAQVEAESKQLKVLVEKNKADTPPPLLAGDVPATPQNS